MKKEQGLHAGRTDGASPWKRWLALLSVVLLVLVPQVHTALQHGLPFHLSGAAPSTASSLLVDQASQRGDDDNSPCTLCSVLGSAAQLAAYRYVQPVGQTLKLALAENHPPVSARWCFGQMSRPPPGATLDESVAG